MPCGIFLWSTILNLHSDPLSLIWIQWFVDVVTMATSPTSTLLMTSQLMSCIQTEFFSSSFHSICCYLVITWVWDINKTYQEWWIRSLKPTRGLSASRTHSWLRHSWVLPSRQTTHGFQWSDPPLLVGFIIWCNSGVVSACIVNAFTHSITWQSNSIFSESCRVYLWVQLPTGFLASCFHFLFH